jgi:hypothetical protein
MVSLDSGDKGDKLSVEEYYSTLEMRYVNSYLKKYIIHMEYLTHCLVALSNSFKYKYFIYRCT